MVGAQSWVNEKFGLVQAVCGSFYRGKSMCTANLSQHYLLYAAYTRQNYAR